MKVLVELVETFGEDVRRDVISERESVPELSTSRELKRVSYSAKGERSDELELCCSDSGRILS